MRSGMGTGQIHTSRAVFSSPTSSTASPVSMRSVLIAHDGQTGSGHSKARRTALTASLLLWAPTSRVRASHCGTRNGFSASWDPVSLTSRSINAKHLMSQGYTIGSEQGLPSVIRTRRCSRSPRCWPVIRTTPDERPISMSWCRNSIPPSDTGPKVTRPRTSAAP